MTEPNKAPFGVPVDEFVKNSKQANAKAQVNAAVKLLNDAIKKAKAEGVPIVWGITLEKELKVDFSETLGETTPLEDFHG